VQCLFIELVGLKDKSHHLPTQLSGGQQQRVSIARSLASNPEIILADEPTGALDSVTGTQILEILQKLWREEGKTIIMVTHDLNLAKLLGMLSGAIPAFKASKLKPVDALRYE